VRTQPPSQCDAEAAKSTSAVQRSPRVHCAMRASRHPPHDGPARPRTGPVRDRNHRRWNRAGCARR